MDTKKIERCIEIYKNGRKRYVTGYTMKEFLKKEFGIKGLSNLPVDMILDEFMDNLTVDTFEKYLTLDRFGFVRSDIQDALGISCYKARKLIKEGKFTKKDVCRGQSMSGYKIYIDIYDMEDVMECMEE